MDPNETHQDQKEMLLRYLQLGQQNDPIYDEKCTFLFESGLWNGTQL